MPLLSGVVYLEYSHHSFSLIDFNAVFLKSIANKNSIIGKIVFLVGKSPITIDASNTG